MELAALNGLRHYRNCSGSYLAGLQEEHNAKVEQRFTAFGPLVSIELPLNKISNTNKGYAFIQLYILLNIHQIKNTGFVREVATCSRING